MRSLLAAAFAAAACSSPAPSGRLVVAVTIDWEGAYVSSEGLDAIEAMRAQLRDVPLTHFVSSAYFTKELANTGAITSALKEAVLPIDELAVHLHAWQSLVRAAGIEPKLSPSFLSGTDKILEFEDKDAGFDTDLDVYSVPELRALLRTSRRLLEGAGLPVGRSYRAAAFLGTSKMLQALFEEGYVVDSSSTDHRQLGSKTDRILPQRIKEVWPKIDRGSQPFTIDLIGGQMLEMPIAATADYVTEADLAATLSAASERLRADPTRDVFVVLGFHQETAQEFAARLGTALATLRGRDDVLFTTVERAAALARISHSPTPPT